MSVNIRHKPLHHFPSIVVEYDDALPSMVVVCFAVSYEQACAMFRAFVEFAECAQLNVLYGIRETASIEAWQRL